MAILAFQKPDKVIMLEGTDTVGRFEFRPLEPGYGQTIGNALRRILLSSLEGFAITSVKVSGVDQEFAPIPGVIEGMQDYYTCHAYVNNLSGKEYWEAAQLNAEKEVFFLIRYCSEAAAIDTEHFRIIFREQIYNITFIDNVKYQNKTIKLRAALEKRGG